MINLSEIDLVVLKRNDVRDANAFRHDNGVKYYITSDNKYYYFSNLPTFEWTESCNDIDYLEKHVKPIEKPMKEPKQAEFLVKTDSGYVLQVLDENAGGSDVVRVPDGAHSFRENLKFYNKDGSKFYHSNNYWDDSRSEFKILWQRETLNDQVASAEEYREMISNATIAQSCSGVGVGASLQGQSYFLLNNSELNHRVAKAFNAVRGTNLNEDDVNYIRELINLTVSHYGDRK